MLATAVTIATEPVGGDAAAGVQTLYLISGNLWVAGNLFFGLWLVPWARARSPPGGCPATRPGSSSPAVSATCSAGSALVLAPGGTVLTSILTIPATIGEFWMLGYLLDPRRQPPGDRRRVRAVARPRRIAQNGVCTAPGGRCNPEFGRSALLLALRRREAGADARLVAVGVGDHRVRRRPAVVDHDPARSDRSSDALVGRLRRHPYVDVEALPWGLVFVGLLKPQDRHPLQRIADVVADGAVAMGLRAAGQQGGPHRGDRRRMRGVEGEFDRGDGRGIGPRRVLAGDRADPAGKVTSRCVTHSTMCSLPSPAR